MDPRPRHNGGETSGTSGAGLSRPASQSLLVERTVDRALKALNLVLQAGGFGVVAIDLADVPPVALKRIPFTTWLRVQRTVEGSDTACVLVVPEPLARSAGGVTLTLGASPQWAGSSDRSRRLAGLDLTTRVVSPRRRVQGDVRLAATATATSTEAQRHRVHGGDLGMCLSSNCQVWTQRVSVSPWPVVCEGGPRDVWRSLRG